MQRLTLLLLVGAITVLLFVTPAAPAAAQGMTNLTRLPVAGTVVVGGTFDGTLKITRFDTQGGRLTAVGSLNGTLTDSGGSPVGTATDVPVTLAVQVVSGSCDGLSLVLGPQSVELLGRQVSLGRALLEFSPDSHAGNLIGNLLCAVGRLLDSNASLNAVAQLLNQILRALG